MKFSSWMAFRYLILFAFSSLLWSEKAIAFPQQAVFAAQVEDDGNIVIERKERSLDIYDEFSGDGDPIGETGTDGFFQNNPPPIKISSLHILSSTTARFTNTSVTSKLVNRANISQETEVLVRLPEEAFITELFIEVDGKIYRSTVETKEKAQKIYDTARERGQTASQVKQKSEKSNDFSVSINVAPLSSVKCTLIYQQLLLRKKGFFENKISIRPKQIVPDLKVNVYIIEPQGLDEVQAWLQKEEGNDFSNNDLKDHHVNLTTPTRAHIRFQPSKEEQLTQSEYGIVGDFVIKYDVVHTISGGNIQVVNGYFVHHFSPEGIPPIQKNVVFVIDVSGSMSGIKIEQVREAMLTILDQLRERDTFNIVTFSTLIKMWQARIVQATTSMIETAKGFVRELRTEASTDLFGGIDQGISLLEDYHLATDNLYVDKSLSMIIMLSDGLPSSGVTNLEQIKKLTKDKMDDRFSLFNLGFGTDVDDVFLEKLAGQNRGVFRKIYVDSDSSLQLAGFFDEVATPLLVNVEFRYPSTVIDNNSITQITFPSYFEGSELVVAGKLVDGINEVTANVIGATTEHGVIGIQTAGSVELSENVKLNPHAVGNFTQRLWAYLTIKELLRKRLISDDGEEKEEFKTRALELSLKYHFVTPLTSLVVVKPDGKNDTTGEAPDFDDNPLDEDVRGRTGIVPMSLPISRTGIQPSSHYQSPYISRGSPQGPQGPLGPPGPGTGYYSRPIGSGGSGIPAFLVDSDPHFLLHVPHGNVTICFNLMGKPGDIFNLVEDSELGLSINARVQTAVPHPELLKRKMAMSDDVLKRTIFNQMAITTLDYRILISPQNIIINDLTMPWRSDWSIVKGNSSLAVSEGKYLKLQIKEDVQLIVMLHTINKNHPGKSDYLGLYVEHGDGFSHGVHGIIGQFQQSKAHLYSESVYVDNNLDVNGILRVNNRTVKVQHASRDVMLTGDIETCWFAKNNGQGVLDGSYTDYLRNSMFSD